MRAERGARRLGFVVLWGRGGGSGGRGVGGRGGGDCKRFRKVFGFFSVLPETKGGIERAEFQGKINGSPETGGGRLNQDKESNPGI